MKINIYKIDKVELDGQDVTYEYVIGKLRSKDYNHVGLRTVDRINYELFIASKERDSISWLEELKRIYVPELNATDYGKIYHGIMLVRSVRNNIYALSFGRAYHVLHSLCDLNFALDFAESQLTTGNIDTKSSDFVQGTKLRELVNVTEDSVATREGGECFKYVGGKPLFNGFGNRIDCGSSIQFSDEIIFESDEDLRKLAMRIIQIEDSIAQPIRNTFPRLRYITSSSTDNDKYDFLLLEGIKAGTVDFSLYISRFEVIGADVVMNTSACTYLMYCKHHKNNTLEATTSLDKAEIISYIERYSDHITALDDMQIIVVQNGEEELPKSLKSFLFTYMVDGDDKLILSSRKWGLVNQRFLVELESNLDYIQENHMTLNTGVFHHNYSDEDNYIDKLVESGNFLKMHPKQIVVDGTRFELADLYSHDSEELYAIKLGKKMQPLIYAFDQNNTAVKCLNNHREYNLKDQLISHRFSEDEIRKIISAKTYSVIMGLETDRYKTSILNGTFRLTDLGSLLLKLKIVSWANFMTSSGMNYYLHLIPGERQ